MSDDKFFYANGAEVAVTAYDIAIKFLRNGSSTSLVGSSPSKTGRDGEEREAQVLDNLSVFMSPSHAKTVIAAMLHLVREYERQYGQIPLSAEIRQKWVNEIESAHQNNQPA
jgi:hypothetical protein